MKTTIISGLICLTLVSGSLNFLYGQENSFDFSNETLTKSDVNNSDTVKKAISDTLVKKTYKKKCIRMDIRYPFSESLLGQFNDMIIKTLEESERDSSNAIIIDKSEYKLFLIVKGKVHSQYFIELGGNPFNDKVRAKDECTPEGEFLVSEKKNWSNFYKALLLNYPLPEDAERGVEAGLIDQNTCTRIINAHKQGRTPDQYTRLGGLLEIHGSGSGKQGNNGGYNWTLGCIALQNKDVDTIFKYINEKDKITIIRYTKIDLGGMIAADE